MTQNKIDKDLINRIKRMKDWYDMDDTPLSFAERIGVDSSNLSKMLGGRRVIGEAVINKMILHTEFRKEWITAGIGDPLLSVEEYSEILEKENQKTAGNGKDVTIPREVFDQIAKLTETVLSQQRTIETLTQKGGASVAGAARRTAIG